MDVARYADLSTTDPARTLVACGTVLGFSQESAVAAAIPVIEIAVIALTTALNGNTGDHATATLSGATVRPATIAALQLQPRGTVDGHIPAFGTAAGP